MLSWVIWSWVQIYVHGFNFRRVCTLFFCVFSSQLWEISAFCCVQAMPHLTEKKNQVFLVSAMHGLHHSPGEEKWWICERKQQKHNQSYLSFLTHQWWDYEDPPSSVSASEITDLVSQACQYSGLLNMLQYYDDVTDGREQDTKGIWLYPEEAILKYGKCISKFHFT